MADVTGGVPPVGGSPFDVPGDFKKAYDHFGDPKQFSFANAAALPASGNWAGRLALAIAEDRLYRWNGAWKDTSTLDHASVAPVVGAGWSTPSGNLLSRRGGMVTLQFNAGRSVAAAAGATIVEVPVGYRGSLNAWVHGWGLGGAPAYLPVYYDAGSNLVRLNTTLGAGQSMAVVVTWPI